MEWPYMFEWLFDMYLYAPVTSLRINLCHNTDLILPSMFYLILGYCYLSAWFYRRKNKEWRARIELCECGECPDPHFYVPTPSPRFADTKVTKNMKRLREHSLSSEQPEPLQATATAHDFEHAPPTYVMPVFKIKGASLYSREGNTVRLPKSYVARIRRVSRAC